MYNVQSFSELFEDCGLFAIYFVADKDKLEKCLETLGGVIKSLFDRGLQVEEIETARAYIRGNLLLSLENSTTRMMRIGRNEVLTSQIESVETTLKNIDNVTVEQASALIKEYLDPQNFCVAAVGPIEEERLKELWQRKVVAI